MPKTNHVLQIFPQRWQWNPTRVRHPSIPIILSSAISPFFSWLTLHSLVANILSLAGKITVSAGWKSCFTDNIPVFCLVQDSFGGEITIFFVSKLTVFILGMLRHQGAWMQALKLTASGCNWWSAGDLQLMCDLYGLWSLTISWSNPIWFESNLL